MTLAQRNRLRLVLAAALTILTVVTLLFRQWLAPVAEELMAAQVNNEASDAVNAAIDEQIAAGELVYDKLVVIEKDAAGNVTAIRSNMAEINRLKTGILFRIDERLEGLSVEQLSVPAGSVFLPELFSGRGPGIPIRVLAVRSSDANFHNEFSSAGINQTLHRIMLDIRVDVTILTWTGTREVTVDASVAVAETVIVGTVPSTYFGMKSS